MQILCLFSLAQGLGHVSRHRAGRATRDPGLCVLVDLDVQLQRMPQNHQPHRAWMCRLRQSRRGRGPRPCQHQRAPFNCEKKKKHILNCEIVVPSVAKRLCLSTLKNIQEKRPNVCNQGNRNMLLSAALQLFFLLPRTMGSLQLRVS